MHNPFQTTISILCSDQEDFSWLPVSNPIAASVRTPAVRPDLTGRSAGL